MFVNSISLPERFRGFVTPVVAVAYLLSAELGHLLSFEGNSATFWPASGVALAAYLFVPARQWILVLLGTLIANLLSDVVWHEKTVWVSLGFWIANTVESMAAVGFVRLLFKKEQRFFSTAQGVLKFILGPCLFGTAVGATFGAGVVWFAFGVNYIEAWQLGWSGDFVGMLLLFPVVWELLETTEAESRANFRDKFSDRWRVAEFAFLLILVGLVAWFIFGLQTRRLAYVTYPVLVALSMRFRVVGAAVGILVMAVVIVAFTAQGRGLFGEAGDFAERAFVVQLYLLVTSTTFITLAALLRERLAAERARLDSQRMLKAAAQGGNVGLWDWQVGSNEVRWSDECHYQLGESLGTLKNFRDWESRVHPDDLEAANEKVAAAMETKDGGYESTFRLRHLKGGYRWILSRGRIETDRVTNVPIRMSGTHVDITELVEVKRRLEAYLNLLGATDGVWDWDVSSGSVNYTPRFRELLGLADAAESELLPTMDAFVDRVHPEDRDLFWNSIQAHINRSTPFECEFRIRHRDNLYRWMRSRGQVLRDKRNDPVRMAGSIYDITDRKDTELDLVKSNRDLAQFAYVASHDLQEPLRAIAGFCGMLERRYGSKLDEQGTKYIRHTIQGVQRMKSLIDDLLTFSRVGNGDLTPEPVDLNHVVSVAVDSLAVRIKEVNAQVHVGDLHTVNGHESLLIQLMQNLIANAIKFSGPETRPAVEVFSRQLDRTIEIYVKDNGIGIAEGHQDQIYTLFERLHHRDQFAGTGIGLAICKRIVERHNATIRVESMVDEGAVFIVSLPTRKD